MPTSMCLPLFKPTARDKIVRLHARLYRTNANRPISKLVYTQANKSGRSARFDLVMDGQEMQPHIHSGMVTVIRGDKVTRFFVFVKNHRRLPLNASMPSLARASWKGDILVLKRGVVHDIVGLNRNDYAMADFAVQQFILRAPQRARYRIPMERHLVFRMN